MHTTSPYTNERSHHARSLDSVTKSEQHQCGKKGKRGERVIRRGVDRATEVSTQSETDTSFQAVPVNARGVAHSIHTALILTTQSGAGFMAQPRPTQKRQHPTTCLSACGANSHSVIQTTTPHHLPFSMLSVIQNQQHPTTCLLACTANCHTVTHTTTPLKKIQSHRNHMPFGL